MLQKETYLNGGGGNNQVKDYTHIVTVGKSGVDWYDYGYNSEVGYGGISPSVLFPNTPVIPNPSIIYLYVPGVQVEDYIQTKFKFDGLRWDIYDIYIGRSDTKYVDYVISAEANDTIYFDGEFFSKNDIGKQVKLWISTTPPPLVRRRASNRLARIATFIERWHDA